MQNAQSNKKPRQEESASGSSYKGELQSPDDVYEPLNTAASYLTSEKISLNPETQERADISTALTSLCCISKRLQASITAAQISEIPVALEIHFTTDQSDRLKVKFNRIAQNSPC
jgi:hypothetical protein